MTQRLEVDVDTERVQIDGAWLTKAELSQRIQAMLASHDFRITRLSEALEQLSQAVGAYSKSVTVKLTAEQYAKLEAAGQKLGKSPGAFARDLLGQVLTAPMATAKPSAPVMEQSPAPVVARLPAPIVEPTPAPVIHADVTPEEAAAALTITPKKRDPLPGAPPAVPPVMTPVSTPVIQAPVVIGGSPTVVVDLGSPEDSSKTKASSAQGEGRRWFNRT